MKTAVAEGYFFLADIFIAKEESMKKEKESAPGGWRGWRKVKLVEKIQETPLHTSFLFAPEDGSSVMDYQAGQYLSIRLPNIPGGYKLSSHYHLYVFVLHSPVICLKVVITHK